MADPDEPETHPEVSPEVSPAALRRSRGSRPVVGPFTGRHLLVAAGTLVTVAVALMLLTLPITGSGAASPPPAPGASFFVISNPTTGLQVGQQAPELSGVVDGKSVGLSDLNGNPITLAALRGRPVWIVFWASWCAPCQQETPVLRAMYEEHKAQGLALVAISVQETTADDVRAYASTYDLQFTVGFDATSAVFKTYLGYGLPTHIFLDRNGIIRAIHLGPLSQAEAEQTVAPLLAQ